MEKLSKGTKVIINLNSADAHKLGLSQGYEGPGTITGNYPLGHYVRTNDGKIMAITDKYNAITAVD